MRCHKDRIVKMYCGEMKGHKIYCQCGKEIGIDKGTFYKMIAKAFVYKGDKINR